MDRHWKFADTVDTPPAPPQTKECPPARTDPPMPMASPYRISLAAALLLAIPCAAADLTGEQIYRKQCASCHGPNGEGTKDDYPHPLAGNRSVRPARTPDRQDDAQGRSRDVHGDDADKVAAYIYDAFYSKAARERNKPPRIELSRLTVRQYRNAVADLIASFRSPRPLG